MFKPQRTTSNRIGFIFSFFVTVTKSITIDQVDCCSTLTSGHFFVFEIFGVVTTDTIDVFLFEGRGVSVRRREEEALAKTTNLESASLFELLEVTLALERRSSSEEDVPTNAQNKERQSPYSPVVSDRRGNSLDGTVDVFLPSREPGNLVIVHDTLPTMTFRSRRYRNPFSNVDRNLFGTNPRLSQRVRASVKPPFTSAQSRNAP